MNQKRDLLSGGCSKTPPHNSKLKAAKISKYFVKPQQQSELVSVDSPFKNTLSDIDHNSALVNDDSDFKTPDAKNKRPKPFQEQKHVPKRRLKQKKISSLMKSVEENFAHNKDVNSEHLQLALALSKSISDQNVDDTVDNEIYKAVYASTQDKLVGVRKTLEEFGFRSERTNRVIGQKTVEVHKNKRKKSKFQYVTPILFLRSEEERQKIIASKIALVLNENIDCGCKRSELLLKDSSVSSEYLRKFCVESRILTLNSLEADALTLERLYIKNLILSPTRVKCGSLLKNWSLIPGRETTPTRDDKSQKENALKSFKQEEKMCENEKQRSVSPDLFESDDESNFDNKNYEFSDEIADKIPDETENNAFATFLEKITTNKKPSFDSGISEVNLETTNNNMAENEETDKKEKLIEKYLNASCSQENLSRHNKDELIETEKGILHFESFCKESEILSQDYVDLTQSSDEEKLPIVADEKKAEDDSFYERLTMKEDIEEIENKQTDLSSRENEAKLQNNFSFEETFLRESLNITDYIHNILNQNETNDYDHEVAKLTQNGDKTPATSTKHPSFASTSSQESIYISDEELNYSSLQANAKDTDGKKEILQQNSDDDEEIIVQPKTPEKNEQIDTTKPEFVVRTTNVTPMPDFDGMNTPKVTQELKKFGVKAMKRKRGVQLLKYIYDATHPFAAEIPDVKKRKVAENCNNTATIEIVGDVVNESEDLIFEKRQSNRIHSCRLPLQIAFHNFLCCNPEIRKQILLYEPLQLEELHLMLKNQGFKYHIKDLLTFLDQKCITVRTNHK